MSTAPALLGAAVLLALTGCATAEPPEPSPSTSAPSRDATPSPELEPVTLGGSGSVCSDATAGTSMTVAIALRNPGDEDVVITAATADGRGAAIGDASVAGPASGDIELGIVTSEDPPSPESDIPGWADREEVGQASLLAGESRYLVFSVRMDDGATDGWVTRVRVDYELPGVGVGATAVDAGGLYGFGQPDGSGGFSCG